jgi:hypothetical protein
MTARVWPIIPHVRWSSFGALVLISATLLFSQLALAQFTQQGPKLVGTLAVGTAQQGYSVALSADGNTAIVGGPGDNSNAGAAWVFVQLTKDDCQKGGSLNFPSPPGPFTSQGQCISYFAKLK